MILISRDNGQTLLPIYVDCQAKKKKDENKFTNIDFTTSKQQDFVLLTTSNALHV